MLKDPTPKAMSWTPLWVLELLHHIAEVVLAIEGPQALVGCRDNAPGLLRRVVEGRQKHFVWPWPWPSTTTPPQRPAGRTLW